MMTTSKRPVWIVLLVALGFGLSGCGLLGGDDGAANAPKMESVSVTLCASEVPELSEDGEAATCLTFEAEYEGEAEEADAGS